MRNHGSDLLLLATLTGCFSNYGRVKRNTEVTQAFVANRVPSNYNYYYWGRTNQPYVIIGIDPDYHLQSRIWREVKPDTPWMLGTRYPENPPNRTCS